MDFGEMAQRVKQLCPDDFVAEFGEPARDHYIRVKPERFAQLMNVLRDDEKLSFEILMSITAVDTQSYEPTKPRVKKGEQAPPDPEMPEKRFDLVYHLLSVVCNHRLVIKVYLDDDVTPSIATLTSVWPAADWHEREAWDLMGIRFDGHPDLRRILCCEDWVGHPLRKDYEFPKQYHGISAE